MRKANIPPKALPVEIGQDGIKVSVIVSAYNRRELMNLSLLYYDRQTMPKSEFELVVVVDNDCTDDIKGLCAEQAKKHDLQIQYVKIDKYAGAYKPKSFNQALANNVGLKLARGSVIAIVCPETILCDEALEHSWNEANEGKCVYGKIFCSSQQFVENLHAREDRNSGILFKDLLAMPGAQFEQSQFTGFWWYYVTVQKGHIMAIGGVDERFMEGITGEDDDFAYRMFYYDVPLVRSSKIVGIHQYHMHLETASGDLHSVRTNRAKWYSLRQNNLRLLTEWRRNKTAYANTNIDWGSLKTIVEKEVF
jgi:glycosyltransferase involved in cell wall biosynthesis